MPKKPSTRETLSEVLLRIIRERGITSYALAKKSGVHATALQRFVNGERGLTLESAEKIVAVLDLILTEREAKPKKK